MLAIVRLALQRPYTFVVLAMLILIFGPLAALTHADRHLPGHQDPGDRRGLDLSRPVARRHVRPHHLLLRAPADSTTVNDIEHIESQSLPGIGIVKIFFQPGVDIRTATAQVTSLSQTVLKQMPPGITPPLILNYNASTVPILQLALSSPTLSEQQLFDLGQNFIRPALAIGAGRRRCPRPMAARSGRSRSTSIRRRCSPRACRRRTWRTRIAAQNQIIPAGTAKIGSFEYNVKLNDSPEAIDELNNLPIKTVERRHHLHPRRRATSATARRRRRNIVHVDGAPRGADDHPEERLGLDARDRRRASRPRCRS